MSEISVKIMPPSVVKTIPQAGEMSVDPSIQEISVTFSKDMLTKEMWSWCYDAIETFPQIDEKGIRYLDDKRTCVLPVQLQPRKTYVIWINSQKYNAFRDTENNPAIPYLLVFQTADENHIANQDAILAAESWLLMVDNEKYMESWNEAAQYFKCAISTEQWVQAIQVARKPLGKNIDRKFISESYQTSLPGAPDGEYVVIQFQASFENKKSATETITPMRDKDGVWRVSGYYIN